MEYLFQVTRPGNYRAWYLASYPTNLGYLHGERMDDGEHNSVDDSILLAPNVWRWSKGPIYKLSKGEHRWSFPSPHAWCGGTQLDKLLLAPENMTDITEILADSATSVSMPQNGELTLRRIKAELLSMWCLNADLDLNGGSFKAEYRYDNQPFREYKLGVWKNIPAGVKYIFLRFHLERSKTQTLTPFVYNTELRVEEK